MCLIPRPEPEQEEEEKEVAHLFCNFNTFGSNLYNKLQSVILLESVNFCEIQTRHKVSPLTA